MRNPLHLCKVLLKKQPIFSEKWLFLRLFLKFWFIGSASPPSDRLLAPEVYAPQSA